MRAQSTVLDSILMELVLQVQALISRSKSGTSEVKDFYNIMMLIPTELTRSHSILMVDSYYQLVMMQLLRYGISDKVIYYTHYMDMKVHPHV